MSLTHPGRPQVFHKTKECQLWSILDISPNIISKNKFQLIFIRKLSSKFYHTNHITYNPPARLFNAQCTCHSWWLGPLEIHDECVPVHRCTQSSSLAHMQARWWLSGKNRGTFPETVCTLGQLWHNVCTVDHPDVGPTFAQLTLLHGVAST